MTPDRHLEVAQGALRRAQMAVARGDMAAAESAFASLDGSLRSARRLLARKAIGPRPSRRPGGLWRRIFD